MDIKNFPGLLLSLVGWLVLLVGLANLAATASGKFNNGWIGLALVLSALYSIIRLLHYLDEKSKDCIRKMDESYRQGYNAGKDAR